MSKYYFFNENSKLVKLDENRKPTEILDHEFLFYVNDDIKKSFPYLPPKLKGKWIMRFKHSEDFDKKWNACCKMYDEGKLIGIRELGCSTGYKNPQSSDHIENVINFFCGSAMDREKMLEYGENLLKYIPYFSDNGLMTYETNLKKDSKTTGYSLYQISVPKNEKSVFQGNRIFLKLQGKETIEINENKIPTEIVDYQILSYKNMRIYNSFPKQWKFCGKWTMRFKHAEGFDQKWKDCCKLYDEGKLSGIRSLECSTGFKDSEESDQSTGEIVFYCGSAEEKFRMLEIGKNLLKHIPYYNDAGYVRFESIEPVDRDENEYIILRIPVPKDASSDVTVNRIVLNSFQKQTIEIDENKAPSEIIDYEFINYYNYSIHNSFPYYSSKYLGKWIMFFKHIEDFDKKWKDSCKLYDEGKLIGIRYLRCSTIACKTQKTFSNQGVILFYCGPSKEKSKILDYGKNLLKYIPYVSEYGHIPYKSHQQTNTGTRTTGNHRNYLYKICLPKSLKVNENAQHN